MKTCIGDTQHNITAVIGFAPYCTQCGLFIGEIRGEGNVAEAPADNQA